MSISEFGLRPESALVGLLPQVPCEQSVMDSFTRAARYEAVSGLARSIASMTPATLSRHLVALFNPFFPCDFVNIVVLDSRGKEAEWRSFGDDQLASPSTAKEESTLWSVYEQQQPLWVEDWQHDERAAVQKEAHSATGIGYRSLCRLPLCTPQGCLGVLSVAGSTRH